MALRPNAGHGFFILEVPRTHDTPVSVGLFWTSDQLVAETSYLTTHSNQPTNIHAPPTGGVRTRNLNRRAAVHLHLRPRVYWDRRKYIYLFIYCIYKIKIKMES